MNVQRVRPLSNYDKLKKSYWCFNIFNLFCNTFFKIKLLLKTPKFVSLHFVNWSRKKQLANYWTHFYFNFSALNLYNLINTFLYYPKIYYKDRFYIESNFIKTKILIIFLSSCTTNLIVKRRIKRIIRTNTNSSDQVTICVF